MNSPQQGLQAQNENPVYVYNLARQMFDSKEVRTIVVEGVSDKKYFGQWISKARIHVCNGKESVVKVYNHYKAHKEGGHDFMCFIVDVDFDVVLKNTLINDECFIYNSLDQDAVFNDMEIFLVNTRALDKVFLNLGLDFDFNEVNLIRLKMREASSVFGSFRVADCLVRRESGVGSSLLGEIKVDRYFDRGEIFVNHESVSDDIRDDCRSADLIDKARCLRDSYRSSWSLSRGHDVTNMLSLFLSKRIKKCPKSSELEMMLRLACEGCDFEGSPVGKRLRDKGWI